MCTPRYATLGMSIMYPLYGVLAYLPMTMEWFLIQGDVNKAAFTLSAILPGYTKALGILEVVWGPVLYALATLGTNKVMSII